MKPTRSKKRKSGPDKPAASSDEKTGVQGEPQSPPSAAFGNPAAEAPGKAGASTAPKAKRGDRDKRTLPPVRMVSDPVPERKTKPTGEQPKETEVPDRQDTEIPWGPRERIAQRAYALYEAGGYEHGKEVEHWLEAERQLEAEARGRSS